MEIMPYGNQDHPRILPTYVEVEFRLWISFIRSIPAKDYLACFANGEGLEDRCHREWINKPSRNSNNRKYSFSDYHQNREALSHTSLIFKTATAKAVLFGTVRIVSAC